MGIRTRFVKCRWRDNPQTRNYNYLGYLQGEQMKLFKTIKTIPAFVIMTLGLVSCKEEVHEILASSVTLDKTSVEVLIGQTVHLSATVLPEATTDKTIRWSSSDDSVAMVDEGTVTAHKVGQATIKATCGNKEASCVVNVLPIVVEEISFNKTSVSLKAGETVTLTATVKPDDATDKTVTWSTSDASVATVNDGVVTAKKVGTATITAKAGDKSATCEITVVATPVTSVTLNKTSASVKAGETVTLTATVKPDDATDKTVTWSTSDATVATVSNGVVTAKKVGTATITAKAGDKSATCEITVVSTPVTAVTLNKTSVSLKAGETVTLTATVKPDDATDKTVTWGSSDESVAKVENGIVTAIGKGLSTITAKAGDTSATCMVTVSVPVENVTLNKTELVLQKGQEEVLVALVSPDDATDKTINWSSSNVSVVRVDQNGAVAAEGAGTAVITASAGTKSATCTITVTIPVESISLNMTKRTIKVNETVLLKAEINPSDATTKSIQWSSSDVSIASVGSNGMVKGLKEGVATITASADGKSTSCTITVLRSTAGGNEGIGYDE